MTEYSIETDPTFEADVRFFDLQRWLSEELELSVSGIVPASADASFRRYFRVTCTDGSCWIAMDAPPEKEDIRSFVVVSALLSGLGLHVPEVLAQDEVRGFLLLTDLGPQQYLGVLDNDSVNRLYDDALQALVRLQSCPGERLKEIPLYGEELLRSELDLFSDWYLQRLLGVSLSGGELEEWEEICALLIASALEQPRVLVHRDFHSRNLMVSEPNPGILDFQDAVIGPVSYDLVSLLKDCYIAWPRDRVEAWVRRYQQLAGDAGVLQEATFEELLRWFDLMGVQRHLKATGIFARLKIRDGKSAYLQDIPRTLGYVKEACARYPELERLERLLAAVPGIP